VATGLLAEARIASGPGVRAIAGGGDARRLAAEIDRAIGDGGRGILSFGIAGGLQPGLAAGTIVIASTVVCGDGERVATDEAWTARLREALPYCLVGVAAAVDAPVASSSAKEALHAATGAAAADMESHIAGRAAARARLPFAVLRVTADPAERVLPEAAVKGLRADGRADVGAVLRSVARNPAQLAALTRVTGDARRALAQLARCKQRLGPDLGFPVLDES
jgi:hopanoid-associated phosphorylase